MNLFSNPLPKNVAIISEKEGILDDFTKKEIEWIQAELKSRTAVRPIFSLHKYFARRSGRVFNWAIGQVEKLLNKDNLYILDPMAGGGTILWEAYSRGHKVYGQDLNPMASLIQAAMFFPGSMVDLHKDFQRIINDTTSILNPLWQTSLEDGTPANIIYSHFVRKVNCPACNEGTRLYHNSLLNRGRTRGKACDAQNPADHWCPHCGTLNLSHQTDSVECQHCCKIYSAEQGSILGKHCTCENCRETFVYRELMAQGSSIALVAIEYIDPDSQKKLFKKPDVEDSQKFYTPGLEVDFFELGKIPIGSETARLHKNGFHTWEDLFTARQKIGYTVLFQAAQALENPFCRLLATLAISSTLEYNCNLVAYNFKYRKSHHLFTHHAFPVPVQGVEGNLPGLGNKGAGTPINRFRDVLKMMTKRSNGEKGLFKQKLTFTQNPLINEGISQHIRIVNGNSIKIDVPEATFDAIITDPPYHDNVQYGELTEFFLVWLRHYLPDFLPKIPDAVHVQLAEATANQSRTPNQNGQFQEILGQIFKEGYRVTKPEGVMLFSFHDTDKKGWIQLGNALKYSGWYVCEFVSTQSEFLNNIHLKDYKDPLDRDLLILCTKKRPPNSFFSKEKHPELLKWGNLLIQLVNN